MKAISHSVHEHRPAAASAQIETQRRFGAMQRSIPPRVVGEDDLTVGQVFDGRQCAVGVEVRRSIRANDAGDLGKARQTGRSHAIRLWRRPVSSTIDRHGVDGADFGLRHGECRQIEAPIAIDQRSVQIKGCKTNLRYKSRGLRPCSVVSIDNMISGDPDHALIEPQKKARCALHILWKGLLAVMPINRRANAQGDPRRIPSESLAPTLSRLLVFGFWH